MRRCSSCLPLLLLFSLFSFVTVGSKASEFRICAFNVQNFNLGKAANYRVLHTLKQVLSRCDISLLQHVVDSDGQAIEKLLAALNRYEASDYEFVASEHLGNTADDMQQYVFIYRTQTVNLTGQHQYNKQSFVRSPFVVRFQSNKTVVKEFILVPLHSEPKMAVEEIDKLYDVFLEVSEMWNNTNVMFLGDFHASCAYVNRNDKKNIRLFKDTSFSWLIGDRVDTTVTDQTSCAYDRIVVHGEFLKGIKPFSAKVFNFGTELKLSKSSVVQLSDHFPVEVILKSSAFFLQATPLLSLLGASAVVQSFLSAL